MLDIAAASGPAACHHWLDCDAIVSPATVPMRYDRLTGVRIVIVEGAGHSPMVEKPERTLALIRDFLTAT